MIRAEQLNKHTTPLQPFYLISGDEPLLKQEACDLVRQAAKQQNYLEREVFTITAQFDWQLFSNSCDNLSLFAEKKLIELRFTQKPNTAGRQALVNYCENSSESTVVLVSLPKIDASTKTTKWFKALDKTGICLQIWPVDKQQFPQWLKQRLRTKQLNIEAQALELLSERTEGNLLAAKQEVEKLSLLFPSNTTLTSEQILQATGESSRYDVFGLIDLCLAGKIHQISKVLNSLKQEGVEPILVLWALNRELHTLLQLIETLRNGNNLESALTKLRIWEKRKPLFRHYFQHNKRNTIYRQLTLASCIDQQIKGIKPGDPWENLFVLCLNLAGEKII